VVPRQGCGLWAGVIEISRTRTRLLRAMMRTGMSCQPHPPTSARHSCTVRCSDIPCTADPPTRWAVQTSRHPRHMFHISSDLILAVAHSPVLNPTPPQHIAGAFTFKAARGRSSQGGGGFMVFSRTLDRDPCDEQSNRENILESACPSIQRTVDKFITECCPYNPRKAAVSRTYSTSSPVRPPLVTRRIPLPAGSRYAYRISDLCCGWRLDRNWRLPTV
jgi:hypothetical protein